MMDGSNSKFLDILNDVMDDEYGVYGTTNTLPEELLDYSSQTFDSVDGFVSIMPDGNQAPHSLAAQADFYQAIVQEKEYGMVYDFELPASGNFIGNEGASYTPSSGQTVNFQSGSIADGTANGNLFYDDFLTVTVYDNGGGTNGDNPGDDLGIATNPGNDADRGYNQTPAGNQYLEILPSDEVEGGVGFLFEQAASGFGFFLMGREADKRDVYIEIILRDPTSGQVDIVRQLTGSDPLNEGGQQYVAYKLDPSSDYVIAGFSLTEESPANSDSALRDIFAVDDLVVSVDPNVEGSVPSNQWPIQDGGSGTR